MSVIITIPVEEGTYCIPETFLPSFALRSQIIENKMSNDLPLVTCGVGLVMPSLQEEAVACKS